MTNNEDTEGSSRSPARRLAEVLKVPEAARLVESAARRLTSPRAQPAAEVRQRASRADGADVDWLYGMSSSGGGWARPEYGEYYATSVSIYSAIKLRAEAISRPNVVVHGRNSQGSLLPVPPDHPAQRLLDRVNPWYSRGDLWRATEIYLNLWGSSFWALEKDEYGRPEIWPLRPDRVSILPDGRRHIRGFVYTGRNGPVAYTPEEMLWIRYFNPLEEFAGLSPVAPLRLAVDMGKDGLRFNRNFLRNSAQPDFVLLTDESMTDKEIQDFYDRWEARHRGPAQAHRPAIASFVRDIKTLGFSHKDMDFIEGLRWSLEEVSRAYGVPKPLLSDLERATFANINAAERIFWRNTMLPEMEFIQEQLTRMLLPRLGYPDLVVQFDVRSIEALREDENSRVHRETSLLDRGVLTINEVRRSRNLPDVPWGDSWAGAPGVPDPEEQQPDGGESPGPSSLFEGSEGQESFAPPAAGGTPR